MRWWGVPRLETCSLLRCSPRRGPLRCPTSGRRGRRGPARGRDRKSVVQGKSVDLGGGRIIKKASEEEEVAGICGGGVCLDWRRVLFSAARPGEVRFAVRPADDGGGEGRPEV